MTRPSIRPAEGGEAGFSVLAHVLTAWFALDPPMDRRQVTAWSKRGSRNRDGKPFPQPVRVIEGVKPPQPSRLFSVREVLDWYAAGLPETNPNQHTRRTA